MAKSLLLWSLGLALLGSSAGCVRCPREECVPVAGLGFADVVFVANGAGDYRKASQAISAVVVADHLPLRVELFLWSHGHGRIASDQLLEHLKGQLDGKQLSFETTQA